MKFPQIGELLPNGHIVDAAYCVGEDRYVLAHRESAPEPYVVWAVDQDGDTRNGRYFTDPTRAQRHFANCCYDWTYDPQPTEKAANSFTDTDKYMVIKIVYGDPEMDNLRVFVNDEELADIKEFSIVAKDGEYPTYHCEKQLPIPGKYLTNLNREIPKHIQIDHGETPSAECKPWNEKTIEQSFNAVCLKFAKRFHESMQKQHQQYRTEQRAAAQLTPDIQTAIKNVHSVRELELFTHFWWLTNKYLESDIQMQWTLQAMYQNFLEDKQII